MQESVVTCKELSEWESQVVEGFFTQDIGKSLHLLQPRDIFLRGAFWFNNFFCCIVENICNGRYSTHSLNNLIFIRRLRFYAPTVQSCNKSDLYSILRHHSCSLDVEKRAFSAYLFRYCCSNCFTHDSILDTLVTYCVEDTSTLVKLCSVDSLFYWVEQGEGLYSRLFLFLKYIIPNLFVRQQKVIRYFIARHLLQLVDMFLAIPDHRRKLALHRFWKLTSLKLCNDSCCWIRQMGLELLQKLLFQPSFLILHAFIRKKVKPELYSFVSDSNAITGHCYFDSHPFLSQKLQLYNNKKGLVALEVAGSLIQLAEDSCHHIRLSFVLVIDLLLSYHVRNPRLTTHIVHCVSSLLYDWSGLIRRKAINVLTKYAQDLCFDDVSLEKLLVCLLDPDFCFRASVAFLLSKVMLSEDCNLDNVFKHYTSAFERFPDDFPILVWSIERLGAHNLHIVRKCVFHFSQLVNNNLLRKWKLDDQLDRNILYINEQPRLLLIFKFFLSSNDEKVIERLPRLFVLLFDLRRRKLEQVRLSLYLQQHSRVRNDLVGFSSLSVLSSLSFELAFFGYECLRNCYNCLHLVYQPLLKLYIHYLEHWSSLHSSSLEPIIKTAKCLFEWLRLWPASNNAYTSGSFSSGKPTRNVEEKNKSETIDCKTKWSSALLDTIVQLELFQSSFQETKQLCSVLKQIYETRCTSHLGVDFYRATRDYFYSANLRSIRYSLRMISVKSCSNMDISNKVFLELLCAVSVQNLESDKVPPLFIRLYSSKNTTYPLTDQLRLETFEQLLKEGRKISRF